MDEKRIETEVRRATERCLKSAAPLVCVAELTIELIDHQWPNEDALEVGRRVLKTIKANEASADESAARET